MRHHFRPGSLPSGNNPLDPFTRLLPRYHPSPNSSSLSINSTRSPFDKLSSSELRAEKSSSSIISGRTPLHDDLLNRHFCIHLHRSATKVDSTYELQSKLLQALVFLLLVHDATPLSLGVPFCSILFGFLNCSSLVLPRGLDYLQPKHRSLSALRIF